MNWWGLVWLNGSPGGENSEARRLITRGGKLKLGHEAAYGSKLTLAP